MLVLSRVVTVDASTPARHVAYSAKVVNNDDEVEATKQKPLPMQLSVLVETVDGNVHAFDALSGEKLWKSKTGGSLVTNSISSKRKSEALGGGFKSAIVPGVDGYLYSIKVGTQAIQKLGIQATDVVQVSPNIAGDGSIVLGSKKDAIVVIHPLTGQVLSTLSSSEPEKIMETFEKATLVLREPNATAIGASSDTASGGREGGSRLHEKVVSSDVLAHKSSSDVSDLQESDSEGQRVTVGESAVGSGASPPIRGDLQPVLLSRTEYTIKAFNHKYNEELWNVSYTDCKQLSAAQGFTLVDQGSGSASEGKETPSMDAHLKQFSQIAESLKVVATTDNVIRVANTMYRWTKLWSEQLDSTPVFASLSDSVSGHVHNIKLWSSHDDGDDDEEEEGEDNILVGIHADGIFIMPKLKEDARHDAMEQISGEVDPPPREPDPSAGQALALRSDLDTRLAQVMRSRGGDRALVPFPLVDGSRDEEILETLPVILLHQQEEEEDKEGGSTRFKVSETLLDTPEGLMKMKDFNRRERWYTALMTLLIAVLFTFGGYLYEYYVSLTKREQELERAKQQQMMEKAATQAPQISNRRKIANEEIMIGNLIVSPKILGYGSAGTIVFEGVLNHREVAVKRLLREFYHMAEKEIKALIISDAHPSVLRCFAMEEDDEFIYLALEKCQGTLADFVNSANYAAILSQSVRQVQEQKKKTAAGAGAGAGYNSRQIRCQSYDVERVVVPEALLDMLADIAKAIASLHKMGIVHRDLKPQNVLLTRDRKAKVSDMGLSKQLHAEQSSFDGTGMGSSGWQAPEVLSQKQKYLQRHHGHNEQPLETLAEQRPAILEEVSGPAMASSGARVDSDASAASESAGGVRHTKAVDVFSLGCIIFFTLTRRHPFGEMIQRDNNILLGKFDLRPMTMLRIQVKSGENGTPDGAPEGEAAAGESDKGEAREHPASDHVEEEEAAARDESDSDAGAVKEKSEVLPWRKSGPGEAQGGSGSSEIKSVCYVSWFEANNMVYAMLAKDPKERPKMKAVLAHPFWWSFEKRVGFILDLSHRMENEDRVTNPALLNALEMCGHTALNGRPWHKQIDLVLWEESKKFRNYSYDSVRDLTRLVRNKVNHYRDNSEEVKALLGPSPHGVYAYFATTFPKFFLSLYSFGCRHLRTDPLLQRYFSDEISLEDMRSFVIPPNKSLLFLGAPDFAGNGDQKSDSGSSSSASSQFVFPQRPGEPECEYFVRTGFCRYGAQCRYDHPAKYQVQRNSLGYPIRPSEPECEYFAKSGICKYGQSCRFSHPERCVRQRGEGRPEQRRKKSSGRW